MEKILAALWQFSHSIIPQFDHRDAAIVQHVRFGSLADMCSAKAMSANCQKRTSHVSFEMKEAANRGGLALLPISPETAVTVSVQ